MKKLVPLIALIIIGLAISRQLPGLKAKAKAAITQYGGWTEEARKDDPVAFIDYAQGKLGSDLVTFKASRQALAATRKTAEEKKTKAEKLAGDGEALAMQFKQAYQGAEGAKAWPVAMAGKEYTEDQLVTQVGSLLNETEAHKQAIQTYAETLDAITEKDLELQSRINDINAQLVKLEAQKELARVNKLTAEADDLLAKVNTLLDNNGQALERLGDDPVRGIEDILKGAENPEGGSKAMAASNKVLEFLKD